MNFPTARTLLGATIRREAEQAGVPVGLLCGHLAAESLLDPRSLGANGVDLGIAQISRTYNVDVTDEQAFDEDFAIRYMAQRDARAYARYGDWRIAVVSYNSPAHATAWKRNGYPDPVAETPTAPALTLSSSGGPASRRGPRHGRRRACLPSGAPLGRPRAQAVGQARRDGGRRRRGLAGERGPPAAGRRLLPR